MFHKNSIWFHFFFQFEQKKQKEPVPERGKSYVSTLPARGKICYQLINFAKSLDPDQNNYLE